MPQCPAAGRGARAGICSGILQARPRRHGAASIVAREGAATPGVLYEIALAERPVLDRFESLGTGYDRHDDFPVIFGAAGESVTSSTYIALSNEAGRMPFDWYLALVVAGAEEHGLDASHLAFLRAIPFTIDSDATRERRLAATEGAGRSRG